MDSRLLDGACKFMPEINPIIATGVAKEQIRGVEAFVDQILRAAAADFPEGLTYDGYNRCTPQDEFNAITRVRDNKQLFELARSDFYMVSYQFSFQGKPLFPRHLHLPYIRDGGLLYVRGKMFSVSPVLTDRLFSITADDMFIQLTRKRLTFERTSHRVIVNNESELVNIVWSWVHVKAAAKNKSKKANRIIVSTLAHYFFAKYGFIQTLKRYTNADVIVGTDEINVHNYPKDEWVIFCSVGVCPTALPTYSYKTTPLRVAVRKDQCTIDVKSFIGTFYYIVDHYPQRFDVESIDDPWIWKVVLGHIIYEAGTSEGLMVNEIEDHLNSIEEYIDAIVIKQFEVAGHNFKDIHDMFLYVIQQLSQPSATDGSYESSMYDKRLTTLRYLMYDIIAEINQLMFDLRNITKKRKELDETQINNIFNMRLRSDLITRITRHSNHPEVVPVSVSNDNMFFGVTAVMVSQEKTSTRGGSKGKMNLKDPSKHLHASVAEVASYNNLPKADPTGRSRINPCLKLTPDFTVVRDPQHREVLDAVQRLISMR